MLVAPTPLRSTLIIHENNAVFPRNFIIRALALDQRVCVRRPVVGKKIRIPTERTLKMKWSNGGKFLLQGAKSGRRPEIFGILHPKHSVIRESPRLSDSYISCLLRSEPFRIVQKHRNLMKCHEQSIIFLSWAALFLVG